MDTGMEVLVFLAYAAGLLIIFVLAKLFAFSGKLLGRVVMNSVLGGMILLVLNAMGSFLGVHLPINLITSFGVGTLGIPGIVLLYLMSLG